MCVSPCYFLFAVTHLLLLHDCCTFLSQIVTDPRWFFQSPILSACVCGDSAGCQIVYMGAQMTRYRKVIIRGWMESRRVAAVYHHGGLLKMHWSVSRVNPPPITLATRSTYEIRSRYLFSPCKLECRILHMCQSEKENEKSESYLHNRNSATIVALTESIVLSPFFFFFNSLFSAWETSL